MNINANNNSMEYSALSYSNLSNSNTLVWATIGSMLLHICLAYIIPNVSFESIKKPDLLEVKIVKKEAPHAPEPAPTIAPTEPIKPVVKPKPILKTEPLPVPKIVQEESAPMPQPVQSAPPTEVIAVAPQPQAPPSLVPPAPVVTAPPPPPPVGPSEADLNDARSRYGSALWGALEKHKQYPRIAQMRGWQGEVILELLLDGNGKLKSKKVISSSGFDALDKQALDMVEKAAPFPTPPEVLRGSQFSIRVPVPFKLEG